MIIYLFPIYLLILTKDLFLKFSLCQTLKVNKVSRTDFFRIKVFRQLLNSMAFIHVIKPSNNTENIDITIKKQSEFMCELLCFFMCLYSCGYFKRGRLNLLVDYFFINSPLKFHLQCKIGGSSFRYLPSYYVK